MYEQKSVKVLFLNIVDINPIKNHMKTVHIILNILHSTTKHFQ